MLNLADRILIIIPTYNEIINLPIIIKRIREISKEINILIIDDNSPDGTGVLADELAKADTKIIVLHQENKLGLGKAYLNGFTWGISNNFNILIEMDADGSHPPEVLPELINKIKSGYDVVIGSRYVAKGRVVNWPKYREFLSKVANLYAKNLLGVKIKDITAGYRAYTADLLADIDLSTVKSHGYCFQIDLTRRALDKEAKITEVPITFTERIHGKSKMNLGIIYEALTKVTFWGITARLKKLKQKITDLI